MKKGLRKGPLFCLCAAHELLSILCLRSGTFFSVPLHESEYNNSYRSKENYRMRNRHKSI